MSEFSQEELDALRRAYASGVFWVRLPSGEEVRYDNGAALLARIHFLEARMSEATRPRSMARRATFSRS